MKTSIPVLAQIRASLSQLNHAQLRGLSDSTQVPFPTLMKIRQGTIKNPGLETIRKFFPALISRKNKPVTSKAAV